MKRVVILHGYTANPHSHWFPWLQQQLEAAGISVSVPAMDPSHTPDPADWDAVARNAIGTPDTDLVVVGHSLGTVEALRALAGPKPVQIAGLVLVSPFMHALAEFPETDAFIESLPDVRHILRDTPIRLFASDNDEVVEPLLSVWLAEALGEPLLVVEGAGHFIDAGGFAALPQVRDAVLEMAEGRAGYGA